MEETVLPVEIVPVEGKSIVLRARGSELLILPQHVGKLKSCKTPTDFTGYFLNEALLNRPARKLFEAWLRKDRSLWQRIYQIIQKEMTGDFSEFEEGATPKAAKEVKTSSTQVSKPVSKTVVAKSEEKASKAQAHKPDHDHDHDEKTEDKKSKTTKETKSAPAAKAPAKKAAPAKPAAAKKAKVEDKKPAKKETKEKTKAPAKKATAKPKKKG